MEEPLLATFSKVETIEEFKKKMCKKMELDPSNVRVWDYHANNKYKLLDDLKTKLESAQIIDGQPMLLEEKDKDGKFPEPPKKSTYGGSSYGSSYSSYSSYSSNQPTDPGNYYLSVIIDNLSNILYSFYSNKNIFRNHWTF